MKHTSKEHVIIVGGGIAGLSTAYAVLGREPGLDVTILEAGEHAGHGASWANSSMIHPSQAWPWPEAESENLEPDIAINSFHLARRSSAILKTHFDEFDLAHRHRKSGTVKIFRSREALEARLPQLEILAGRGLRYEFWTAQQFSENLNLPIPDIYGAIHFPDDHSGPARIYCQRLINAILDMGGVIKTASPVTDISSLKADHVIICAGDASAELTDIGVFGVRGYSRTYHLPGLGGQLPSIPIMDDAAHFSVTPLGDHLRVSGGADAPDKPNPNIYNEFQEFVFKLLPHLKDSLLESEISDWTAVRPMRSKGPYIGHHEGRVWINSGHGHMGWTLCAGAAAELADKFSTR